ncbi:MAG TPA: hypothetical protein VNB29_03220 [Chthoniobacterales bacterium]|nr:hypothetical protein [Chthoniobacterales bacterium]
MKLQLFIQLAGLVQLAIAAANFVLPGMLDYRGNLVKVSPIIRQIFTIHALYIVLVLLGFAAMSLFFAADLCTGGLGRFLCAFLAFFWLLRVGIQFRYYDPAIKQRYRFGNAVFMTAFLYLGLAYLAAAILQP